MRTLPGIFLALGIGAVTGLGLTAASVGRGTGAGTLRIGPWLATPKAGTTEADPYARAVTARLGTLPIALADGLAVVAETDSAGEPGAGIVGRQPRQGEDRQDVHGKAEEQAGDHPGHAAEEPLHGQPTRVISGSTVPDEMVVAIGVS